MEISRKLRIFVKVDSKKPRYKIHSQNYKIVLGVTCVRPNVRRNVQSLLKIYWETESVKMVPRKLLLIRSASV